MDSLLVALAVLGAIVGIGLMVAFLAARIVIELIKDVLKR